MYIRQKVLAIFSAVLLVFGLGCSPEPEESNPTVDTSEEDVDEEDTGQIQLAHHGNDGPCDPNDWHIPGFDVTTYDPVPGPSVWEGVPGADVEAGMTNTQTPFRRKRGMDLVKLGKEYELYHELNEEMPINPDASYELNSYPPVLFANQAYLGDTNVGAFGQIGTQIDALSHFAYNPPGNTDPNNLVFYGGFTGSQVLGTSGAHHLGVQKLRLISTRAVMIDVKRYMNDNEPLPPGFEITLGHVICTLKAQKMDQHTIKKGDVVLINTGWEAMWEEPSNVYYQGGPGLLGATPGLGFEASVWLTSREIAAVGSDNWPVEVATDPFFQPQPVKPNGLPFGGHHHFIVKTGTPLIESMHLGHLADDMAAVPHWNRDEETYMAFIHVPRLPMKGASGSTSTPVAYR